jgi:hypothetical protein
VARALALTLLLAPSLANEVRAHEATLLAATEEHAADRAMLGRPSTGDLVPLRVTLRDAESGRVISGNVRITRADGTPLALDLTTPRAQEARPGGWHASAEPFELLAPAEKLRIEAFQGLETVVAVRELDLEGSPRGEADLALTRFATARERGLASGNTHLHLMRWERARVESYLRDVTAADQLDFAWVSFLTRNGAKIPYTTNEFSRAELEALSTETTRFGWGQELRHNVAHHWIGYGHVLLLDLERLVEPVSIGPVLGGHAHDAPGLATGIAEAHAQDATAIWAHGKHGFEDLPSWLLGRLDAQNLFDGTAHGERPRGEHATFASVHYPLLEVGLATPLSTGTDWFIHDLARVYVPIAGERTTEAFLAALRAGRSFITNGPLLELEVEGAEPGGVIAREAPGSVRVVARAVGRGDFGALEIVANGAVVARAASVAKDGHFEARIAQRVALDGPAWIAARVDAGETQNEFGKALFAHTSPVIVEIGGERRFDSSVARELALEMDWNARWIREEGSFASDEQAAEVTASYAEAIDALAARMNWGDWLWMWAIRAARTLRDWIA